MSRVRLWVAVMAVAAAPAGCSWPAPHRRRLPDPRYVHPTIAVLRFENRAPGPARWQIGDGIADILVHALFRTGQFNVIERRELEAVFGELQTQGHPEFRPEGRVPRGRLKNCQYLIRGTITDFGHVAAAHGGFLYRLFTLRGRGQTAVLGMTITVVDVETGQIVASVAIDKRVRAGNVAVEAVYKDVAFGGAVFYQTPLGRATRSAVSSAVSEITAAIARQPWQPRVARVEAQALFVSGGADRRLRPGAEYDVIQRADPILDPQTGDLLGLAEGPIVGVVAIEEVYDHYSLARILSGRGFEVGQSLRPRK